MTVRWLRNAVIPIALLLSWPAVGQVSNRFDLNGPTIDLRVQRGTASLPIGSVPNLQPGDVLWVHADLPQTQSVHYLLVVIFLRGTTNPPPESWFTKLETWDKKTQAEGTKITVPDDAQQAVMLLAPDTGGGFQTLRSAVRGRPGIFVRASQDLNEAGYEQARINQYLANIQRVPSGDPKALQEHSAFLARTLALKPNDECFKKAPDQQLTCLTQTGNQMLLDDGRGQTVVSTLSNGAGSDLIAQASYTQLAGGGLYSAYVGAIVDMVRLMANLHTAHYQYIPGIAANDQESMHLKLNAAPSFNDPKSVIVVGLPPVQKATPPPLRAANADEISCLAKPGLSLPVDGAPLVFSTTFAHELLLHVKMQGREVDLPLKPDAYQGGLTIVEEPQRHVLADPAEEPGQAVNAPKTATSEKPADKVAKAPDASDAYVTGTVHGKWGFDDFTGPELKLQSAPGTGWALAPQADGQPAPEALIAGQKNKLAITSTGTACVEWMNASFQGTTLPASYRPTERPKTLAVDLSLEHANAAGKLNLDIHQYGTQDIAKVETRTFIEAAKISQIELHAGDRVATLSGTNLGQVAAVEVNGAKFSPDPSSSGDNLVLHSDPNAPAANVRTGDSTTAHVTLNDGRVLPLKTMIAPSRPQLTLLNKHSEDEAGPAYTLSNPEDLSAAKLIHFVLKSAAPFPRSGTVEIANADNSLATTLSLAPAGGLVLQDAKTVLGTLDPQKAFGPSSFGALRLRAVVGASSSDWMPFATLVRLPVLNDLRCSSDPTQPCALEGSGLFVIEKVARDPEFTDPVNIPDGLTASAISVPALPGNNTVYLKLRDDPSTTVSVTLPAPAKAPGDTAPKKPRHASGAPSANPGAPAASAPASQPPTR